VHKVKKANLSGIYIHIPFCRQACTYCDFHFSVNNKHIKSVVKAIITEISLRNQDNFEPAKTLYFGGGTPSLLEDQHLLKIITELKKRKFLVSKPVELTLECNPEDLTTDRLTHWKKMGVNRLSIGVQTFDDQILHWMRRAHTGVDAIKHITLAKNLGFENLSADLIFGLPGTSIPHWEETLLKVTDLNLNHLSIYNLTVEKGTLLNKQIRTGKLKLPDEEAPEMFISAHNILTKAGYRHYEISNYSKPGYEAIHNKSYWQNTPYLGFGPSAHSYQQGIRSSNPASNALYIQHLNKNILPLRIEENNDTTQWNDYVITSLRTNTGITMTEMENRFPRYITRVTNLVSNLPEEWLAHKNLLGLSPEGWLFTDSISVKLID
jgi:oxygen-independent coproporphyrinogen-3 oxidase